MDWEVHQELKVVEEFDTIHYKYGSKKRFPKYCLIHLMLHNDSEARFEILSGIYHNNNGRQIHYRFASQSQPDDLQSVLPLQL